MLFERFLPEHSIICNYIKNFGKWFDIEQEKLNATLANLNQLDEEQGVNN